MLMPATVLPGARRALRRAVQVECEVLSECWDEPVLLQTSDLSPFGAWIETPFPLDIGAELLLTFRPPRWAERRIVCLADVVRVALRRRRRERRLSGMGVRFTDMAGEVQVALSDVLVGMPPPLPSRREPPPEPVWVEIDPLCPADGDEQLVVIDDDDLVIEPLGELLS